MRIWPLALLMLVGCPFPCPSGTRTNGGDQCIEVVPDIPDASVGSLVNRTAAYLDVKIEVSRHALLCAEIGEKDEAWVAASALRPGSDDASKTVSGGIAAVYTGLGPSNAATITNPAKFGDCAVARIAAKSGAFKWRLLVRTGELLELRSGATPGELALVGPRGPVPIEQAENDVPACSPARPLFTVNGGGGSGPPPLTVRSIEHESTCEHIVAASAAQRNDWTLCAPDAWSLPVGTPLRISGAVGDTVFESLAPGARERVRVYRGAVSGLRTETKQPLDLVISGDPCRLSSGGVVRRGALTIGGVVTTPGATVDLKDSGVKRRLTVNDVYRVYVGWPGFLADQVEVVVTDR